jgi:uncharacterized protein (DUF1015 family)
MKNNEHPLARPFAALRPEADQAGNVIAPPYDVIDTAEARQLATGRPWSFLHISRPEIDLPEGTDPYSDQVYAAGAAQLQRMVREGILVCEAAPCFYAYRLRDGDHTQTGIAFTASTRAYEQNRVRKHEFTRPDKENDRVRNILALDAQTGPVLCAYKADPDLDRPLAETTSGTPLLDAKGPNNVQHTIWRIDAPETIRRLEQALNRHEAIYIADGHHRAAAAARVAHQRGGDGNGNGNGNHEYFLVVAFADDQMRILDYNRVVRDLNGLSVDEFLARAQDAFDVHPASHPVAPDRAGTFGMYLDGRWYRLSLKSEAGTDHDPVASLDVSRLQDRLLHPVLGIENPRTDPRIDFVGGIRGLGELQRRVDSGRAAVAFSMFATRMDQLMAVADAGLAMPPKSTWFEPKLADGLLSHQLS